MKNFKDYKTLDNNNKQDFNLIGKIRVKVLVVASIVLCGLVFTQLVFASGLALDGQKLSEMEDKIQELEAQNTTLKVEIAKQTSLATLSQKADSQGYKKPSNIVFSR